VRTFATRAFVNPLPAHICNSPDRMSTVEELQGALEQAKVDMRALTARASEQLKELSATHVASQRAFEHALAQKDLDLDIASERVHELERQLASASDSSALMKQLSAAYERHASLETRNGELSTALEPTKQQLEKARKERDAALERGAALSEELQGLNARWEGQVSALKREHATALAAATSALQSTQKDASAAAQQQEAALAQHREASAKELSRARSENAGTIEALKKEVAAEKASSLQALKAEREFRLTEKVRAEERHGAALAAAVSAAQEEAKAARERARADCAALERSNKALEARLAQAAADAVAAGAAAAAAASASKREAQTQALLEARKGLHLKLEEAEAAAAAAAAKIEERHAAVLAATQEGAAAALEKARADGEGAAAGWAAERRLVEALKGQLGEAQGTAATAQLRAEALSRENLSLEAKCVEASAAAAAAASAASSAAAQEAQALREERRELQLKLQGAEVAVAAAAAAVKPMAREGSHAEGRALGLREGLLWGAVASALVAIPVSFLLSRRKQ
jgi:hypothetical protein